MPRANRHFLPGHVWHITHRCHEKNFLLKFARDRRRYLRWVFEAKKRFGLSVLDYMVTRNHIHLLIENGEKLTREERKRFSELKKALQNQSDKIMKQIAANQPNVKKGEYANK